MAAGGPTTTPCILLPPLVSWNIDLGHWRTCSNACYAMCPQMAYTMVLFSVVLELAACTAIGNRRDYSQFCEVLPYDIFPSPIP